MNAVVRVQLHDNEVTSLSPMGDQRMLIRFSDGSEVIIDRKTMERCEAVWQHEIASMTRTTSRGR